MQWRPGSGLYGIAPMIFGSLCVTAGAVLLGAPLGVLTAVYTARFCPRRLCRILRPAIALLAGIPSVIYGFFGVVLLVPAMRALGGGGGKSALTASILLGIMILPTIIGVAEAAIRAVPESFHEGALALGATHEQSVFFVLLPAARSGVLAGVILGVGRSVGETMAVIMVAGNQAVIPDSLLLGVRTLTANIVLEMGYAADLHREALIATAVVLFVFILCINLLFSFFKRRDLS
jgi:phosphate transport system permease protein